MPKKQTFTAIIQSAGEGGNLPKGPEAISYSTIRLLRRRFAPPRNDMIGIRSFYGT